MKKNKKKVNIETILIKILSYGAALFIAIKAIINMFSAKNQDTILIINNVLKIFLIIMSLIAMIEIVYRIIEYFKGKKD